MSAIVLAGGGSRRFGQDKGLVMLADKPLVFHVLDRVAGVVDEIVVVINSETQRHKLTGIMQEKARIVVDEAKVQTPLAGALAGFENAHNEYALLLGCDAPFLSSEVLRFLLDVCFNKTAAIPRWPNGNIEPLQAAYHAGRAAEAARKALERGKLDMHSMIEDLQNVRYVSTLVLEEFDPKLLTLFNINTPNDLRQAEAMIKHHPY